MKKSFDNSFPDFLEQNNISEYEYSSTLKSLNRQVTNVHSKNSMYISISITELIIFLISFASMWIGIITGLLVAFTAADPNTRVFFCKFYFLN